MTKYKIAEVLIGQVGLACCIVNLWFWNIDHQSISLAMAAFCFWWSLAPLMLATRSLNA